MPIRLFNTLTKSKDDFTPLDAKNVRMYVCGPTVYDFAHIGNARPAIVFDLLFRLLRHEYGDGHVTYVRNITDVDDKINARAAERGITIRALTEETAKIYFADVAALGCLEPTISPRATEHIAQMVALIERLIAAGHAYAAEGHVLFDVSSKPDYGKLANRSLKEMVAGARVEVAPYKKGAMDFVLWKPSESETPGWDSPWGRGRPGWHIECSAMAGQYLGETFDIHGGGIDLMFPHHENEIAQSEGAHHNHPLANVWMHNGFLQVEGEKMSKSAGNFFTIRDLLADWPGEVLRFNMLRTHYRQPIDWTINGLKESETILNKWRRSIRSAGVATNITPPLDAVAALYDDLNTPLAIKLMHHYARTAHGVFFGGGPAPDAPPQGFRQKGAGKLIAVGDLIGIDLRTKIENSNAEIEAAIAARKAARAAKDFAMSDRIRDELLVKGIVLKDGPDGTTWEVKR